MLDFSKLRTPRGHGDTLVVPDACAWPQAARANATALPGAETRVLGVTLAEWRRRTRAAVVGQDVDRLVIVTGHQPGFEHPGVWAKHVLAMRMAGAVDGVAVNLAVDSDAAKRTTLDVPGLRDGRMGVSSIRFVQVPAGITFEQIPPMSSDALAACECEIEHALGEHFARSQMPTFLKALRGVDHPRDWVDQVVTGREAIEAGFGVHIDTRRLSDLWCSPLLVDMLLHAERFASVYNRALATYRQENRVRGPKRPIPDLACEGDRCEVPVWAHQSNEPRRRVFATRTGDTLRLFADKAEMGTIAVDRLDSCASFAAEIGRFHGWELRPRALALTIWARLLLADLFIHGIGGAKYDRISDRIIADYYAVCPPHMACVSATLHLGLPVAGTTERTVTKLRHDVRDLLWNPQRHVSRDNDVDDLLRQRSAAVTRSDELRNRGRVARHERRAVFSHIRACNQEILNRRNDLLDHQNRRLAEALRELGETRVAEGREYFFGLYDNGRLEELLDALPAERAFRV